MPNERINFMCTIEVINPPINSSLSRQGNGTINLIMKTTIKIFALVVLMLNSVSTFAGLEWNKGILTNPDNLMRVSSDVAYASDGSIYVTGYEKLASGSRQIVTKKYSSTGALLVTRVNSYIAPVGTILSDYSTSIQIDGSGNVYVLGAQFGSTARGNDMVILKYNSSLVLQWKRLIYNDAYPITNFNDYANKMILDAAGNIYVTGTWYNPITSDDDQIMVRKYNSAGVVQYTATIPESSTYIMELSSDMCLDNSGNITIVGRVENSGVTHVMYARVNASGTNEWTKTYTPPTDFHFNYHPRIVCTPAGLLYISISLYNPVQPSVYVGKLALSQFAQNGTKNWDRYTMQLDFLPNQASLRIDAANNPYTGADFTGPYWSGAYKYRIYKYHSSGILQWAHIGPESAVQYMRFELFGSSSLFVLYQDLQSGYPEVRKLNATNGTTVWTEAVLHNQPSGYNYSEAWGRSISINTLTSEVAYCGYLVAATGSPGFDMEYRWNIRKYGATSPRLSQDNGMSVYENEVSVSVYPNPAIENITVAFSNEELPDAVYIYNSQGKLLFAFTENVSSLMQVDVSNYPAGIIFINSLFGDRIVSKKIVVEAVGY